MLSQSYSTYVASTIHVRIASQRGPTSEASRLLGVCVEALQENGATNPGVKKMHQMIQSLMSRMGVLLPQNPVAEVQGEQVTDLADCR